MPTQVSARSRPARFLAAGLIFALSFIVIAILVITKRIAPFNKAVTRIVQGWENPTMTGVMKFFSAIGTGVPVVLITAALMFVMYSLFRRRWELLYYAVVLIISSRLNTTLKSAFHLARPQLHRLVEQTGYGFPSGHAMGAVSMYGLTAFLLWQHIHSRSGRTILTLAAGFFILAIGISRIYLGVHYPSDVIGGYLAGAGWICFSIWIYRQFLAQRRPARQTS